MISLAAVLLLVRLFPAIETADNDKLADEFANDLFSAAEKYEADQKKTGATPTFDGFYSTGLTDDSNLLYQHMRANAPDTETFDSIKSLLTKTFAKYNHQMGTMNHWVLVKDVSNALMKSGSKQGQVAGLIGTAVVGAALKEDLKTILFNAVGETAKEKAVKDVKLNYDAGGDSVKFSASDPSIADKVNKLQPAKLAEMTKHLSDVLPSDRFPREKIAAMTKDAFANVNGKGIGATQAEFRKAIFKSL